MTAPEKKSVEEPMATPEEWAAMKRINPHFTFRERTAFLVGYRLQREALTAERRAAEEWRRISEAAAIVISAAEARERKMLAALVEIHTYGCDYCEHGKGEHHAAHDILDQSEKGEKPEHNHPIYADQSYVNCPACERAGFK